MNLYKVKNWASIYENNRSRTVQDLRWVAIPNRHDGEHYSRLMLRKDAAEIFSCWILILQVASRCHPRGTLLRSDGKPHDAESLSLKTRSPVSWFVKSMPVLTQMAWLEEVAIDCQPNDTTLTPSCQSGDEGGKGGNGMGGNGKQASNEEIKSIKEVIDHLNEKAEKSFECIGTNVDLIKARIKEGYSIDKMKSVVDVMVSKWKKDPKMKDYLRPSTLFNKEKFSQYVGFLNSDGKYDPTPKELSHPTF